ncbi:MAG: restriction endonuclease subunit S [Mobiluncus porci]|nr:restriction endonuclease subunit S [Mobiluncus porci]MDD7541380.1 restriction endonuclease subunit S [Mobiluncus porci]MDY5747863.1 restriction endonuclease subunit S [Mobiluncus porci]
MKSNPQLDKGNFTFTEVEDYPYFTRTAFNNGIAGYVEYLDSSHLIPKGCLAVGMIGMQFFYMDKDFYAGQFTKRAIPKSFALNRRLALFFTSLLNRFASIFQSVLVRNFESTFYEQNVTLPVRDGEIDFDFIEEFVAELEATRLAELEAYLEATGLRDYTLTPPEIEALNKFDSLTWRQYRIGDLFKKLDGKKATKKNVRKYRDQEFCVPVVYCKFGDNGIMYWGRKNEFATHKNAISVIYNGAIAAGKVYAQKEPTGILAESYFIALRNERRDHDLNLFLSTTMEKVLYPKYSRDFLATWAGKVENDLILLPAVNNGEIDYEFIPPFISGLKKLAIKDVVDFADRRIAATEQAIAS